MTQVIEAGVRPTLTPHMVSTLVGPLAAVIPAERLLRADRSAPAEVLWAEGGLFPFSIDKRLRQLYTNRLKEVGLLLMSALGFGLIPSANRYSNNIYLVVQRLLRGTASLVALDPPIFRTRWWVVAHMPLPAPVVLSQQFGASAFRAFLAPLLTEETNPVKTRCWKDPAFIKRSIFTPFRPPHWGDGLTGPTHTKFLCDRVRQWL